MHEELTAELLRKAVTYDPSTGYFYSNRSGKRIGTRLERGYRHVYVGGKNRLEHRLAFLYMTGEWPKGQTDHINRLKDDNRWENLRDVSAPVNQHNRVALFRNNTSGQAGVSWNKERSAWQVMCSRFKRKFYLGYYFDYEEAAETARLFYSLVDDDGYLPTCGKGMYEKQTASLVF